MNDALAVLAKLNEAADALDTAKTAIAATAFELGKRAISPSDGDLILEALSVASANADEHGDAEASAAFLALIAKLKGEDDDTDPRSLMSDEPPFGSFSEER